MDHGKTMEVKVEDRGKIYTGEALARKDADSVNNMVRTLKAAPGKDNKQLLIEIWNILYDYNFKPVGRVIENTLSGGFVYEFDAESITVAHKNWVPGYFTGKFVRITNGVGAGQQRQVKMNTEQKLILYKQWHTVPDATSEYIIFEKQEECEK